MRGVGPQPAPRVAPERGSQKTAVEEITPRSTANLSAIAPSGGSVSRRFSGGLPRWLLADAGAEAEGAPAGESAGAVEASSAAGSAVAGSAPEAAENETEPARKDL